MTELEPPLTFEGECERLRKAWVKNWALKSAIEIVLGGRTMIHYHETFPTEAEALAFIERVCASYHPLGYGTSFREPAKQEDGTWLVVGSRAASCD